MPMPPLDVTGKRFGKLVAIKMVGKYKKTKLNAWLCVCDCGEEVIAHASQLKLGGRTSCGCKRREKRGSRPDVSQKNKDNATHGMTNSGTYHSWRSMLQRCNNKNSKDYKNYGGRGISVCKEWFSFVSFLNDMGEKPKGKSLDRINNNGNYEPNNCRWAAQKTQSNNTRVNRYIEYKGETKTVTEFAREYGIEPKTLLYRIKVGWPIEVALTTPPIIRRK